MGQSTRVVIVLVALILLLGIVAERYAVKLDLLPPTCRFDVTHGRLVTQSAKDDRGRILAVCRPGSTWSPRLTNQVIEDLSRGTRYFTVYDGVCAEIERYGTDSITTKPDDVLSDNLDLLPDCVF